MTDRTRAMLRPEMRRTLLIAALAAVAVALAVGITQTGDDDDRPADSLVSPQQARDRLAGSPPRLARIHEQAGRLLGGGQTAYERRLRELRGLPVVVNLWGSWCGPCRAEFPHFNRASVAFGKQVAFLGVDADDSRGDARRFLARIPVSYPSYEDPRSLIPSDLGAIGLPATVFYDDRGRRYLHQGPYRSEADLAADIRRYALRQ